MMDTVAFVREDLLADVARVAVVVELGRWFSRLRTVKTDKRKTRTIPWRLSPLIVSTS